MSGFEVVGVVLGAIPLIIAALDASKKTSRKFGLLSRKDLYITRLIQSLNEQKFLIESEVLLALSASYEVDEITALLSRKDPDAFQRPDIVDAIRQYLGDGSEVYQAALIRCQRILQDIIAHLSGIVTESQWDQGSLSAFIKAYGGTTGTNSITTSFKFRARKEHIERQMGELIESAKMLTQLRANSLMRRSVTMDSTSNAIARSTGILNMVQNYAQQLYSAISVGYVAGCHFQHETRLFLQPRSTAMEQKRQKSLKSPPLTFKIGFQPVSSSSNATFLCYRTEVKVWEDEMGQLESRPDIVTDRGDQRKVQIILPSPPRTPNPSPMKVEDLCRSLHQAHQEEIPIDLYLTCEGCLCYHDSSVDSSIAVSFVEENQHEIVTLKQIILASVDSEPHLPRWDVFQRIAISFNVASSVMQLHSTPWLSCPLTSSSLCFMRSDICRVQPATYTPQPFITCIFSHRQGKSAVTEDYSTKRYMLELGIMLLELWHKKTIETYAAATNQTIDDNYGTRYDVALNWLNQSGDELILSYMEVVGRCIECTFATKSATPDWEDESFRRSVCEYVLKPLWDSCPRKYR